MTIPPKSNHYESFPDIQPDVAEKPQVDDLSLEPVAFHPFYGNNNVTTHKALLEKYQEPLNAELCSYSLVPLPLSTIVLPNSVLSRESPILSLEDSEDDSYQFSIFPSFHGASTETNGHRGMMEMAGEVTTNTVPSHTKETIDSAITILERESTVTTTNGPHKRTIDTPYDSSRGKRRRLILHCDPQNLSEYQCLLRKHIELFEATDHDIRWLSKGRNKPIILGQIGIRCIHCKHINPRFRPRGSTNYPTKLKSMYEAAQTMACQHLCKTCPNVPKEVRQTLMTMKKAKSSAGGGKQYWIAATETLCLETKSGIIRFRS